jgi:hypothetical protein
MVIVIRPKLHHLPWKTPPILLFYSRDTSRPKNFVFIQSNTTNIRFLVLKHMLKYADFQNRYVIVPPEAILPPLSHETSATAFSAPM